MTVVAEKLREAKALIERGWCQGSSRIGESYCMMGAVEEAAGGGYWDARKVLCAVIDHPAPTNWNDAPERTQAEVLAAFDKAIELAEAGQ